MFITQSVQTPHTPKLGELLLQRGLIDSEQLNSAISLQHEQPPSQHQSLGQILVEQKIIGNKQLNRCLRWQRLLAKTSVLLTLAIAPLQLAQAAGQSNQYSYHSSFNSITIEQHAISNSSSAWAADSEFSISSQQLQAFIPKSTTGHYKTLKSNLSAESSGLSTGIHYRALLSPKSFGLEASYRF